MRKIIMILVISIMTALGTKVAKAQDTTKSFGIQATYGLRERVGVRAEYIVPGIMPSISGAVSFAQYSPIGIDIGVGFPIAKWFGLYFNLGENYNTKIRWKAIFSNLPTSETFYGEQSFETRLYLQTRFSAGKFRLSVMPYIATISPIAPRATTGLKNYDDLSWKFCLGYMIF